MFEFFHSSKILKNKRGLIRAIPSDTATVVIPTVWTEHCLECAAPKCYGICPKYQRRRDGACVRIKDGITPIDFDGHIGARTLFLPWSKIEAWYLTKGVSSKRNVSLSHFVALCDDSFICIAKKLKGSLGKFIEDGWYSYRQKLLKWVASDINKSDRIILDFEVENPTEETSILVDVKGASRTLYFRDKVDLPRGVSKHKVYIPVYSAPPENLFVNLHPGDADSECLLNFGKLELETLAPTAGKKVKLVIWDLDNTLWKGVYIEDKEVELRQNFVDLIKKLDACGIVNSISSKNDKQNVWPYLESAGIAEYFVFPKINWNPKSASISQTISQMNINPDTVVFVDDNPVERDEVRIKCPSVTCIDPSEIEHLSSSSRFNVEVTEDSKKRRSTYKMLEEMKKDEEDWAGDANDFIRQCRIRAIVSSPTEKNIKRCHELIQRTNQLNSSGRRLSYEDLKAIICNHSRYDCYVINSNDKYGDYGIVGFMIAEKSAENETVKITDFVISCRVANRKIEPTLVNYLAGKYGGNVDFVYNKTGLNGPMYKMIEELNMTPDSDTKNVNIFHHSYNSEYPDVVTIKEV